MRCILFISLVHAAGCTVVTDASRHTAGEGLPASQFCEAYADLLCDANANCCEMPVDPTDCRVALLSQCAGFDDVLADDITGYDPVSAARYLAQTKALTETCDTAALRRLDPRTYLPAFLAGTVAMGGTCTPRMLIPLDYAPLVSCQRGLVCQQASLVHWHCQPGGGEGSQCQTSLECTPPLVCIGMMAGVAGTCLPPLDVDSPCTGNGECASYYCSSAGTCAPATVEVGYCGADP
jgi:hypothetical protein